MKITAKLELTVVYDDGGYDDWDPAETLRYMVQHAASGGWLTPSDGPVTVDTYEVRITTTEQLGCCGNCGHECPYCASARQEQET
jgi:hypothetical protein